MNMSNSLILATAGLGSLLLPIVSKIIFAVVVYLVGKWLIKKLVHLMEKSKRFSELDGAVQTFARSAMKMGLFALLFVSIIGILGVETSSIVAAVASCGVAVGLALQGALSNLAGGIMLLIFKPFKLGDYVDAAGVSGTVTELTLFYTVLITPDNKRITVPNGSLMNSNVVDYSAEELRRVDMSFSCAKGESPARVQEIMLSVMQKHEKVIQEGDKAPFARLSGGTNESMQFTGRVWCDNADYWTVYFDLTQGITEALGAAGVQAPAFRVINDK